MRILPSLLIVSAACSGAAPARAIVGSTAGEFEYLMFFGAASVTALVVCRTNQRFEPWLAIGTVLAAWCAGVYGVLAGAWPLGFAVIAYGATALARFVRSQRALRRARAILLPPAELPPAGHEGPGVTNSLSFHQPSRLERMFGPS